MFSYLLGGKLGELLAPRPGNRNKEMWTFLRGGQYDKALQLLQASCPPPHGQGGLDLKALEETTGRTFLHYAAAAGELPLMLELLTHGVDIDVLDFAGNSPLHLAACNQQRHAIEVLLRSGASVSAQNNDKKTPAQLTGDNAAVRELFLRDRRGIFSPVVVSEKRRGAESAFAVQSTGSERANLALELRNISEPSRPETQGESYTLVSVMSAQKPRRVSHSFSQPDDVEPLTRAVEPLAVRTPHTPPPPIDLPPPPTASSTPAMNSARDDAADPDMLTQLLHAAQETAAISQLTTEEFEVRRLAVSCCMNSQPALLKKLLHYDRALPSYRVAQLGNSVVDGWTVWHVAAAYNALAALETMYEAMQQGSEVDKDVLWTKDLQGRTPLHIAAEKGHAEVCVWLRRKMEKARDYDPVGAAAPVDLTGNTPIGCAKRAAKGRPSRAIESSLYARGDLSVFSPTPAKLRAGKSPWRPALPVQSTPRHGLRPQDTPSVPAVPSLSLASGAAREGVLLAYSEAQGWTPVMEDRICLACPLAHGAAPSSALSQWHLCSVLDGHGGAFSSSFLQTLLPQLALEKASALLDSLGPQAAPSAAQWTTLLTELCLAADDALRAEPRMRVTVTKKDATRTLNCLDSSGAAAVLLLVTPQHVVVGNVGDCRAVLATQQHCARPPAGSAPLLRVATPSQGADAATAPMLETVPLSTDHKPRLAAEKERALRAGAKVELVSGDEDSPTATYQIFTDEFPGKLRLSRSFGDFYLKVNRSLGPEEQAVIAVPEVVVRERHASDAFIVLACDGVWDVMSSEEAVSFLGEQLGFNAYGGPVGGISAATAAAAADALIAEALRRGSGDNLSCVVVVPGAPPAPAPSQQLAVTSSSKSRRPSLRESAALGEVEIFPARNSLSAPLPTLVSEEVAAHATDDDEEDEDEDEAPGQAEERERDAASAAAMSPCGDGDDVRLCDADEDDDDDDEAALSPLNTAKQLLFENVR